MSFADERFRSHDEETAPPSTPAVVVCALAMGLVARAVPARASHPEWTNQTKTSTYYVNTADAPTFRQLGKQTALDGETGRMSLFFGAPLRVSGTFGVNRFSAADATVGAIGTFAHEFLLGYHNNAQGSQYLQVGFGTSNCAIGPSPDSSCDNDDAYKTVTWVRNHGQAWGQMVNDLGAWASSHDVGDRVSVQASYDVEPTWSAFNRADAWIHGYDLDAPNVYPLYADASADGCPSSTPLNSATNGSCNNGWTQLRLWHVTWEHGPSLPFPQIYFSTLADQWLRIDEYGTHAESAGLFFFGVLAEDPNTAHEAHDQLIGRLNGHTHSSQAVIESSSLVDFAVA